MAQLLKSLTKLAPESGSGKRKNVSSMIRTSFSGIGVDQGLTFADNILFKGTLQSVGVTLPILGRVSLIDSINFIAHNNGSIMPKNIKPVIALAAARVVKAGRLNFLPSGAAPITGGVDLTQGVGF